MKLIQFLDSNGNEVVDQEIEYLKRQMVKDIAELSAEITRLEYSGDFLQKFCSDYILVTFPTIQSAKNFKLIFSLKSGGYNPNTLPVENSTLKG